MQTIRKDKKLLIDDVHAALRDDAIRVETRKQFKGRLTKLHKELYTDNIHILEYYGQG